jgi:hypothetical protein
VLYKAFGRRLASHGLGVLPDIYEYPMRSLDFSFAWRFNHTMKLSFAADNVLNEPIEYLQGDLLARRWLPGRRLGLSFTYNR